MVSCNISLHFKWWCVFVQAMITKKTQKWRLPEFFLNFTIFFGGFPYLIKKSRQCDENKILGFICTNDKFVRFKAADVFFCKTSHEFRPWYTVATCPQGGEPSKDLVSWWAPERARERDRERARVSQYLREWAKECQSESERVNCSGALENVSMH